jgi:hypothetical protein
MQTLTNETIAAWNQYVDPPAGKADDELYIAYKKGLEDGKRIGQAPAPQWTSEVPSVSGYFWLSVNSDAWRPVFICFLYEDNVLHIQFMGYSSQQQIDTTKEYRWIPIPELPLPAEREETP